MTDWERLLFELHQLGPDAGLWQFRDGPIPGRWYGWPAALLVWQPEELPAYAWFGVLTAWVDDYRRERGWA